MNIDDLTIGEAKELASLFGGNNSKLQSQLGSHLIGEYVIVRTRNEGLNCGYIKALDETGIILTEARRIWYHKPKDTKQSWYEGVANSGLSSDSKISSIVSEKIIFEDYSITVCSKIGAKSLQEHESHEQN